MLGYWPLVCWTVALVLRLFYLCRSRKRNIAIPTAALLVGASMNLLAITVNGRAMPVAMRWGSGPFDSMHKALIPATVHIEILCDILPFGFR